MVHSGAKLFRTKTLLNFASKALSNSFFQKTRFRLEFFDESGPIPLFWAYWLYGAFGGKIVLERSFVHPKKHVFDWNFLMKQAPYLLSEPNWLYRAFWGKIVLDEKLCSILPQSPLKFVFPKNKFLV